MPTPLVERRLKMLTKRLAQLRADLAVDDARLRALVSETPLADAEHREAARHSDAMARHRADLLESIERIEAEQDELLDKLANRRRS